MTDIAAQRTMMVDTQIRPSDVTKFPIIDAMLKVERANFVPDAARATAYCDGPIDLGNGRAILEPRVLGKVLDALNIQPDELVMVVGAGQGYTAAVVARMAEAVVALEEDETMAAEAEVQLQASDADNVAVLVGALTEGAAQHGPYDAILVDGGAEYIPDEILAQLKEGGRIAAIFLDGALGTCRIGLKSKDGMTWRDAFNASAQRLPGFSRPMAFQL